MCKEARLVVQNLPHFIGLYTVPRHLLLIVFIELHVVDEHVPLSKSGYGTS